MSRLVAHLYAPPLPVFLPFCIDFYAALIFTLAAALCAFYMYLLTSSCQVPLTLPQPQPQPQFSV